MRLPDGVEKALGAVASIRRVAGGSIAEAYRLELADGTSGFLKTGGDTPPCAFAAEAAGLAWLAEADALRVPEVLGVGEEWLALGWIDTGDGLDEAALGRGLAHLHAAGAGGGGALPPGTPGGDRALLRLGSVEVAGEPGDDWAAVYAEHRLQPVADLAEARGALPVGGRALVERVCERLPELAGPPEPPARLHGDLWSGNVLAAGGGEPVVVDPAAYGGHREIDLAMLRLFGSPGRRFLAAYGEVAPLDPGHEERLGLYQLLPLLVHAAIFGGGYGSRAIAAARPYA